MTLAHDVTGAGPTVVLVHSTAGDRRMWDSQVPALAAAGFRVLRCDLRGYGESPVPAGAWDDARDVLDLIDDDFAVAGASGGGFAVAGASGGGFALVGASGGGEVAQEIAARWPARVTSLVLLCTAMAGHSPSPELRAFGDREDELLEAGDVEAATELNVTTWLGPSAGDEARAALRTMQRNAFELQLAAPDTAAPVETDYDVAAITAPTLLVSGAHDLPDFRTIALDLADRIPGARHVELDWAGHLPNLERPAAINELLRSELDRG